MLAWVLKEGLESVDEFFEGLIEDEDRLIGPLILIPECTSVIHEQIIAGRVEPDEVPRYVEDLLRLGIHYTEHPQQFRLAVRLARQFGHAKAYDMQYLAAAVAEEVEIVTIDGGMRQAAIDIKHPVRFLG